MIRLSRIDLGESIPNPYLSRNYSLTEKWIQMDILANTSPNMFKMESGNFDSSLVYADLVDVDGEKIKFIAYSFHLGKSVALEIDPWNLDDERISNASHDWRVHTKKYHEMRLNTAIVNYLNPFFYLYADDAVDKKRTLCRIASTAYNFLPIEDFYEPFNEAFQRPNDIGFTVIRDLINCNIDDKYSLMSLDSI